MIELRLCLEVLESNPGKDRESFEKIVFSWLFDSIVITKRKDFKLFLSSHRVREILGMTDLREMFRTRFKETEKTRRLVVPAEKSFFLPELCHRESQ